MIINPVCISFIICLLSIIIYTNGFKSWNSFNEVKWRGKLLKYSTPPSDYDGVESECVTTLSQFLEVDNFILYFNITI